MIIQCSGHLFFGATPTFQTEKVLWYRKKIEMDIVLNIYRILKKDMSQQFNSNIHTHMKLPGKCAISRKVNNKQ